MTALTQYPIQIPGCMNDQNKTISLYITSKKLYEYYQEH